MVAIELDTKTLIERLSPLERKGLPLITVAALNDSAFEVRSDWVNLVDKAFDRPTSLTRRAPLYRKATTQKMQAIVFIRDEVVKGTPPSEYLKPQEFGGPRRQRRSERQLSRYAGFPSYFVPGKSAPRNVHGNIPNREILRILSQLQATNDPAQRQTKRSKKRSRKKRAAYFTVPRGRGKLQPGIVYERKQFAFGSAVRPILIGVSRAPTYQPRFNAIASANRIFDQRFRANFTRALLRRVRVAA